jgi:hypothetical protein
MPCGCGSGATAQLKEAVANNGSRLTSTDQVVLETFLAANGGGTIKPAN